MYNELKQKKNAYDSVIHKNQFVDYEANVHNQCTESYYNRVKWGLKDLKTWNKLQEKIFKFSLHGLIVMEKIVS